MIILVSWGEALPSHAFVKNLKRYAREAGVGEVHLHQTRITYGSNPQGVVSDYRMEE